MVNFKKGETYICTKSNRMWWTVGREYKVVLNRHGDTALPDNEGNKWTLEALEELDDYNTQFKQIKETQPHKPVVPKFVAEFFEASKHALDLAIFIAIRGLDDEEWPHESDFENWLDNAENKPIETLVRMKDGYEVEKEPKWKIINEQNYCLTSLEAGYGNSLHWAFDSTKKKPILFDNEETAMYTAYITGGIVEKV
ncbi:DUF1642 domain-containing protein [Enterococcus durans]|uniref:DUF1642 domain-containing protein n=1 Tax=Enterococcus durans TaxID=53345 RepID=UPI001E2E76F9|nr:DUF1642 domain-containing protein [Enterococcus durans]MCD5011114.1 DUF1642 domain-containing protein [Enterococcus durans]